MECLAEKSCVADLAIKQRGYKTAVLQIGLYPKHIFQLAKRKNLTSYRLLNKAVFGKSDALTDGQAGEDRFLPRTRACSTCDTA